MGHDGRALAERTTGRALTLNAEVGLQGEKLMTTTTSRRAPQSGRARTKSALAALLILTVTGGAESASSPYLVITLANNHSYSAAYARVNKQLTVLQAKREGQTRRAKCRNDAAVKWLADQGKETESWQVAAAERQRNDALAAKLNSELAAQSKLQSCE